jgi:hypothetical protein
MLHYLIAESIDLNMDKDTEALWRRYYCRAASGWADEITPEMYSTMVSLITEMHFPGPLIQIAKPVFVNTGKHDVDGVAKHIDNPDKCVSNPFVHHAMNNIKKLDLKWIDIIIKDRTKNYDEVYHRLDSAADEIQQSKTCYNPTELFYLMGDIIKGK